MIQIYSDREFVKIRKAAEIIPGLFAGIEELIRPGVRTDELNKFVDTYIRDRGAVPAFIGVSSGTRGVPPFPAASCISVNEEVVHGIPGKRVLKDGDIVSIDIGTDLDGYYGDSARTFMVGEVAPEVQQLLKVTREALYAGIAAARPGNRIGDIGYAVQSVVGPYGYGIVREMVGHGVGGQLHEAPEVPNYGAPGTGILLRKGMCLAIEPMINLGGAGIHVKSDGWTIATNDGKPSAHFEHDVQITDDEPVILSEL